jgi:hypothetical protein
MPPSIHSQSESWVGLNIIFFKSPFV